MNFGKLLRKADYGQRTFVRFYFTIGIIIIVVLYIYYTERFQKQATIEARAIPDLVSQFMYHSAHENFENLLVQYVFHEIVSKISYPIIYTNHEQIPVFWKNIGISEDMIWDELPISQKKIIIKRMNRMRNKDHIIPLYHTEDRSILGYTFYDDSNIIKRLKLLPYIEAGFFVVFILFGLYVQSLVKRNEKRRIWIGLAKETAHQFGTPISSLIGWIDFLKIKLDSLPESQELSTMLDEMNTDVSLLKKVASRFGKVGSNITLQLSNIDTVINDCINYFTKRLPHLNNEINIKYTPANPDTMLMLDVELMQWAFENIFKNCIDAMMNKSGEITITSALIDKKYIILIKDEGVGIPKSMFTKIFEPGVTTKSRGWGLGLSLTKRIIEEYHYGKIRVLESFPGEGTTLEINLPRAKSLEFRV